MKAKEKSIRDYIPKGLLTLLVVAVLLASIAPVVCAEGWNYCRTVDITNSGNALTDYQVQVTLNPSIFDYSKANPDGSDIRFTDYADTVNYNYWIEEWNRLGESRIWVNVPSIPHGDSQMYMWYNNPETSSESDGEATFVSFDDFDNLNAWTQQSLSWSASNSIVTYPAEITYPAGFGYLRYNSELSLSSDFIVEAKTKGTSGAYTFDGVFVVKSNNPLSNDEGIRAGLNLDTNDWSPLIRVYGNSYAGIYDTQGNIWYILKLVVPASSDPSVYVYDANRNLLGSRTADASTYSTNNYWGLMQSEQDNMQTDWIFVRKYADPDPATEVSETEGGFHPPIVDPVPEQATILLFSIGLLVLTGYVVLMGRNRFLD